MRSSYLLIMMVATLLGACSSTQQDANQLAKDKSRARQETKDQSSTDRLLKNADFDVYLSTDVDGYKLTFNDDSSKIEKFYCSIDLEEPFECTSPVEGSWPYPLRPSAEINIRVSVFGETAEGEKTATIRRTSHRPIVQSGYDARDINKIEFTLDNEILIGGFIDSTNAQPLGGIFIVDEWGNQQGVFDSSLGFHNVFGGQGGLLAKHQGYDGEDYIYVRSLYDSYAGQLVSSIVRLRADGSLDKSFNLREIGDSSVQMHPSKQSDRFSLYLSGRFNSYGETEVQNHLIRLNRDGSLDQSFVSALDLNTPIHSHTRKVIEDQDNNILVTGGWIQTDEGEFPLVKLNSRGQVIATFELDTRDNFTNIPQDLELYKDGYLLATRNRLYFLDSQLQASELALFVSEESQFQDIAVLPDSRILLTGGFTLVEGGAYVDNVILSSDFEIESIPGFRLAEPSIDPVTGDVFELSNGIVSRFEDGFLQPVLSEEQLALSMYQGGILVLPNSKSFFFYGDIRSRQLNFSSDSYGVLDINGNITADLPFSSSVVEYDSLRPDFYFGGGRSSRIYEFEIRDNHWGNNTVSGLCEVADFQLAIDDSSDLFVKCQENHEQLLRSYHLPESLANYEGSRIRGLFRIGLDGILDASFNSLAPSPQPYSGFSEGVRMKKFEQFSPNEAGGETWVWLQVDYSSASSPQFKGLDLTGEIIILDENSEISEILDVHNLKGMSLARYGARANRMFIYGDSTLRLNGEVVGPLALVSWRGNLNTAFTTRDLSTASGPNRLAGIVTGVKQVAENAVIVWGDQLTYDDVPYTLIQLNDNGEFVKGFDLPLNAPIKDVALDNTGEFLFIAGDFSRDVNGRFRPHLIKLFFEDFSIDESF